MPQLAGSCARTGRTSRWGGAILAFTPSGSVSKRNSRGCERQHLLRASGRRLCSFWCGRRRCSRPGRGCNIFYGAISGRYRLCLQAQHYCIGRNDESDADTQHPDHAFNVLTLARALHGDVLGCGLIRVCFIESNSRHRNSSCPPPADLSEGNTLFRGGFPATTA